MAQMKPKTLEEFAQISGVTAHKLSQYGERFVSEIREFCQGQTLPVPLPSNSQMTTLQLYQQGLTVEEIAQRRGYVPSTIITHLSELIEKNQPVDLNRFVPAERQKPIWQAIQKIGTNSLRSLRDHLGEDYSYDEIRLVRSWWIREKS
jgi:ATP-dependent DNA helicase RecQ